MTPRARTDIPRRGIQRRFLSALAEDLLSRSRFSQRERESAMATFADAKTVACARIFGNDDATLFPTRAGR